MIEKIIRESAFDKKKKKPGLKFNQGLALTGVRTTGPWTPSWHPVLKKGRNPILLLSIQSGLLNRGF